MAIGERIRFLRNINGMTQKWLGITAGFSEKTADIRVAQYESGSRTPKADFIATLADIFEVSPLAMTVPDIDSYLGLMHTMFALEDIYGFKIDKLDDEVCIRLERNRGTQYLSLLKYFTAWENQARKFRNGEISKDEYDRWRYNYPKFDTESGWKNIPSQGLSDAMVKALEDDQEED